MKNTSDDFVPGSCGHKGELITYLYGESEPKERNAFEGHLAECDECRRDLRGFKSVRDNLKAWELGFAPRVEIEPRRSRLQVFRDFAGLFPIWARGLALAGAAAALLLVTLAAIGSRVSVGAKGVSLDFAMAPRKAPGAVSPVSPVSPVNDAKPTSQSGNEAMLTRSQAEALVNEAVARAEARTKENSRAELASLESKLVSTHRADLTAVKSQMRAEQKAMLAKAQSSQTIREWLFAANENRDGMVSDNDKNQ